MVGLGDLPGGNFNSQAYGVSADGSTVVGRNAFASGMEAFRWTSGGGMVGLGVLPGGIHRSHAFGVSANGSTVVGQSGSSASGANHEAFRWTSSGGMVGLGDLPGGDFYSQAWDVSAGNSTVVGRGHSAAGEAAFIWDQANGMRSLRDVLIGDFGLNLTGWTLSWAAGISDDGLTIVGHGTNPDGNTEAWIATLPELATFSLDIKPSSCPNPLNRSSHGVLPVAVVGTAGFDATMIDISSVWLSRADGIGGEAAPNEGPPGPHSVFADVTTPFEGESCDCHTFEGDGIDDLSMKFRTQNVVEALELGGMNSGNQVELVVTGVLLDGTPFTTGGDCITLVGMGVDKGGARSAAGGSSGGNAPPNLNGEGKSQARKGQEATRPGQGEEGNTSSKRGPRPVRRKGG